MKQTIIYTKNDGKIAKLNILYIKMKLKLQFIKGGRKMEEMKLKAGEVAYGEKLVINPAWCKGCGICVAFCPTKTLALESDKVKVADLEKCTQCGLCELRCPDYAIYVGRKKNEKKG